MLDINIQGVVYELYLVHVLSISIFCSILLAFYVEQQQCCRISDVMLLDIRSGYYSLYSVLSKQAYKLLVNIELVAKFM